jgi:hypothetical protein
VFARWVSILLHPFVVFIGLTMLSARALAPQALGPSLIGVALAVIVTGAFVAQRRHGGHWGTVDASHRSERPVLYAVLLMVLAICWWWMRERAPALAPGIVAVAAMLVVAALCNRWIKLSLHMASLTFAAVSLSALSWPWALVATASLPLLGWARVRMARHTMAEVIGGTVLGAVAALALQWWVG